MTSLSTTVPKIVFQFFFANILGRKRILHKAWFIRKSEGFFYIHTLSHLQNQVQQIYSSLKQSDSPYKYCVAVRIKTQYSYSTLEYSRQKYATNTSPLLKPYFPISHVLCHFGSLEVALGVRTHEKQLQEMTKMQLLYCVYVEIDYYVTLYLGEHCTESTLLTTAHFYGSQAILLYAELFLELTNDSHRFRP